MTADERVQAVMEFGFTQRQARFLTLVMRHAGVCVPRQYAAFAGTAYGQKVNAFFAKLLERGYATSCDCLHNRARLYHVHHRPLYEAIGEPRSHYRRPVPASRAIERLMRLDGLLSHPELDWLATEREKVDLFTATVPSLPSERLPHVTVITKTERRVRLFPDDLPIGLDATGRVVFLYLVKSPFDEDFRAVLQRYGDLLRALPRWTLRMLFPRPAATLAGRYQVVFRDELATPLSPSTIDELRWYFEQVKCAAASRMRLPVDARVRHAQEAFEAPRFRVLYRRWLTDGEAAFDVVSADEIIQALAKETGRVEGIVLRTAYRHLSPVAHHVRSTPEGVEEASEGVEEGAGEGDRWSARPQPLDRMSLDDPVGCARDWRRLVAAHNTSL